MITISKQMRKAIDKEGQYILENRLTCPGEYCLEYVFENVNDVYDTNTLIVTDREAAYVFWRVDDNYTCFNEFDLDDPDTEDEEDIFDAFSYDWYPNLAAAVLDVMHDCPDDDTSFRPRFTNYEEMVDFYNMIVDAGLVSNMEEFLTEQVCNDFGASLGPVLDAYRAGVPLADILV